MDCSNDNWPVCIAHKYIIITIHNKVWYNGLNLTLCQYTISTIKKIGVILEIHVAQMYIN